MFEENGELGTVAFCGEVVRPSSARYTDGHLETLCHRRWSSYHCRRRLLLFRRSPEGGGRRVPDRCLAIMDRWPSRDRKPKPQIDGERIDVIHDSVARPTINSVLA